MKKFKILTKPTRINDLNFDDLYDEISSDLDRKINRFRKRHRLDDDDFGYAA